MRRSWRKKLTLRDRRDPHSYARGFIEIWQIDLELGNRILKGQRGLSSRHLHHRNQISSKAYFASDNTRICTTQQRRMYKYPWAKVLVSQASSICLALFGSFSWLSAVRLLVATYIPITQLTLYHDHGLFELLLRILRKIVYGITNLVGGCFVQHVVDKKSRKKEAGNCVWE